MKPILALLTGLLVLAAASHENAHGAVVYSYTGNPLSGSAPYHGSSVSVSLELSEADVLPLLGAGGTVTGSAVEAATFTVDPTTTIDLASSTFSHFAFAIEPDLSISEWTAMVELDLGRGNANPEVIVVRFFDDGVANDGDTVGNNDTFPNNTLWMLTGFALSTNPGSWTLDQIPEPSRAILSVLGLGAVMLRRRR